MLGTPLSKMSHAIFFQELDILSSQQSYAVCIIIPALHS